jgi:hypothetical protein
LDPAFIGAVLAALADHGVPSFVLGDLLHRERRARSWSELDSLLDEAGRILVTPTRQK